MSIEWISAAGKVHCRKGPAQLPNDMVEKISADVIKIVNAPEVRDRIVEIGLTPFAAPSREFSTSMESEHQKWAKVVKDSGATLD